VYTSYERRATPSARTTVKRLSCLLGGTNDEALAGSEMNITQPAVVRCITRRAGKSLSLGAEELEMDRTSLYRAVAPMIRDGWIETTPGMDAGSRSATVTRTGAQVLAKAQRRVARIQERLIRAFGKEAFGVLAGERHRLADCAEAVDTSRTPFKQARQGEFEAVVAMNSVRLYEELLVCPPKEKGICLLVIVFRAGCSNCWVIRRTELRQAGRPRPTPQESR
jgi:DNA-binding MarR family transcriptional regulator